MEDQIYTIWLPLVIAVVFAVVGMMRGIMREAIVAASIILAGFINLQWSDQWSQGLNDIYSGMDKGQEQFILSLIVLWLVVLVVGYGLGTLLPKQKLDTRSWVGGMLLGLLSGAAVAGLTLRYAFDSLDGTATTSRFYQNPLSFSLMVWAVWYPLLLAFLAALVVLLVPLRRAQMAVARPSTASNWGPTARPGVQGALPPQTPAPTMASSIFPPPVAAPVAAGAGVSGVSNPIPYPPPVAQPTILMPEQDAPPATFTPVRPVEDWNVGSRDINASTTASEAQAPVTRSFEVFPSATPAPDKEQDNTDTYSTFASTHSTDSSWLVQSIEDNQKQAERSEDSGLMATTSFGTEHAISPPPATPTSTSQAAEITPATTGDKRCSNCGAPAMPGASFCTECGTRIS